MEDFDEPEIADRAKEYFAPYLPTSDLTPADVPAADGPLHSIISFAYGLNGYWVAGAFRRCAEIAEALDWNLVEGVRIARCFSVWAARHVGEEFGGEGWGVGGWQIAAAIAPAQFYGYRGRPIQLWPAQRV